MAGLMDYISKGYDYITGGSGLADTANAGINALSNAGASASQIANAGKYYTDQGMYSGGLLGDISSFGSGAMNFLDQNKGTIANLGALAEVGGGLYSTINEVQNANDLMDLQKQYYANLESERQRQITKEEDSQTAMQAGLASSGLSNYYGV